MKRIISAGISVFLLSGPIVAMADQSRWPSSGHMWGYGGWMWGSMFMWIILGALLVLGIYAFSRTSQPSQSGVSDHTTVSTPLDILNTRYAKGEIDKDEYDTRKSDLQS